MLPEFPLDQPGFAPAKINLYLHVTGRRADGYHTLDSLVVFADVGDRLTLTPQTDFSFTLEGPLAEALRGEPPENNLVVRAAQKLAALTGNTLDAALTLYKCLPTASGIGGGSTDAAATLRLLALHWGLSLQDPRLFTLAASLGQDIPCCLQAQTCYFKGIGAETDPGPALPPLPAVLVNPRQAVPTPAVFQARQGAFQPEARLTDTPSTPADLAAMLKARTNGLAAPAIQLLPAIGEVLKALESTPDILLARMSGSGATCFGLYATQDQAQKAAAQITTQHPSWWCRPTILVRAPL